MECSLLCLAGEDARITPFRGSRRLLEDELADIHARRQLDLVRAEVEHFQLDLPHEAGMDDRRGYVDAYAEARERTLALDAGGKPGFERNGNGFPRPTQHEGARFELEWPLCSS
jgi:hypothetical protein